MYSFKVSYLVGFLGFDSTAAVSKNLLHGSGPRASVPGQAVKKKSSCMRLPQIYWQPIAWLGRYYSRSASSRHQPIGRGASSTFFRSLPLFALGRLARFVPAAASNALTRIQSIGQSAPCPTLLANPPRVRFAAREQTCWADAQRGKWCSWAGLSFGGS